jgi:hypothetical protein
MGMEHLWMLHHRRMPTGINEVQLGSGEHPIEAICHVNRRDGIIEPPDERRGDVYLMELMRYKPSLCLPGNLQDTQCLVVVIFIYLPHELRRSLSGVVEGVSYSFCHELIAAAAGKGRAHAFIRRGRSYL